MHKDQLRALETWLPRHQAKAMSDAPSDIRDYTVMLRLWVQGPDPLFLMETCPRLFKDLCRNLGISEANGREGIEAAHWQGPGVLLAGTGLNLKDPANTPHDLEDSVRLSQEALWILLARASSCTEEGYDETMPEREKIAIGQTAAIELYKLSIWDRRELWKTVKSELAKLTATIEFTLDERGFPHTDKDHGFYLAYKLGFSVAAVKAGPHTFWGTTPETTLEEQGIVVDKIISPSFGIVFGKEA